MTLLSEALFELERYNYRRWLDEKCDAAGAFPRELTHKLQYQLILYCLQMGVDCVFVMRAQ